VTNDLGLKDLLGLERPSPAQIEAILDKAASFKESPPSDLLTGRTVAFLFSEPSTRTRSSFEMAAKRLGAEVLSFSAAGSSLSKGETMLDTMLNLQAIGVTHFVVRHERSGVLEDLAPSVKACVVNAGDGWHEHPTQALLDLMTLRERWNGFKGRKVVVLGDIRHSRVARSNLFALKKLGAKVVFCGPTPLVPDAFKELGATVEHDAEKALRGADAAEGLICAGGSGAAEASCSVAVDPGGRAEGEEEPAEGRRPSRRGGARSCDPRSRSRPRDVSVRGYTGKVEGVWVRTWATS
jgi:aspartate carbamoyltransferase catalytic subunit